MVRSVSKTWSLSMVLRRRQTLRNIFLVVAAQRLDDLKNKAVSATASDPQTFTTVRRSLAVPKLLQKYVNISNFYVHTLETIFCAVCVENSLVIIGVETKANISFIPVFSSLKAGDENVIALLFG